MIDFQIWEGVADNYLQINRLSSEKSMEPLSKAIRGVGKNAPAAINRYLYYPDHLVCMPNPKRGIISSVSTFLTEPIFTDVLKKAFYESWVRIRPSSTRDESIGSFISRRYGSALADNLVSALFHGIYAGDIYKLSARQLLPGPWYLEVRDPEESGINLEIADMLFKRQAIMPFDTVRMINRMMTDDHGDKSAMSFLQMQMLRTAMYSFVKGLGQLKNTLLTCLENNTNVTFKTNDEVRKLDFDSSNQKFNVTTASDSTAEQKFDYTVCTLGQNALATMLTNPAKCGTDTNASSNLASSLKKGAPSSVNVMVVNLYYKSPNLPVPPGFGYLIPRSVPAEQNPERALGVIFSSETAGPRGNEEAFTEIQVPSEEDSTELEALLKAENPDKQKIDDVVKRQAENARTERIQIGQDTASGTKLAVMLGGHWWSGWSESDLPDEQSAIEMAKSVIARHLKISEQPILAKARLQKECIPQYQVGYRDDMARIHEHLKTAFDGRMKVLGPWWQGGVGVNDCVKNARDTSRRIREAWDDQTGLEDYVGLEKWVLIDKRSGMQVMDPLQKG